MIKLNPDELAVSSFSPEAGGSGDELMLTNTDPRACPYTQGWDCTTIVRETDGCATDAAGCESGGGAAC